jgi:hypothetical protein
MAKCLLSKYYKDNWQFSKYHSAKCLLSKHSTNYQLSIRQNGYCPNVTQSNVSQSNVGCPNVAQPNIYCPNVTVKHLLSKCHLAKCLLSKCHSYKFLLSKCHSDKCLLSKTQTNVCQLSIGQNVYRPNVFCPKDLVPCAMPPSSFNKNRLNYLLQILFSLWNSAY